jgi:phosphoribosylformylglycinamidine cyclo-ligase
VVEGVVDGIAKACRENGAALIGGETAEMPGFYPDGEYDLAGYIVGVVEKENLLDGSRIKAGDTILALGSSGLHTNGYSLARKVFFDKAALTLDARLDGLNGTLREALMAPHRSYLKALHPLIEEKAINGLVHITGGGFQGNIPRVLPHDTDAVIDRRTWEVPALFRQISELGQIDRDEMDRAFNMGLGMLVVVDSDRADELRSRLVDAGEKVHCVGRIEKGSRTVRLLG